VGEVSDRKISLFARSNAGNRVDLLSALDLAVSKIGRFSSQDRDDITTLGKHGLIKSAALRRRSEQAMGSYVGNLDTLKDSINLACRIVEDAEQRKSP
jgi:hypothetical protein